MLRDAASLPEKLIHHGTELSPAWLSFLPLTLIFYRYSTINFNGFSLKAKDFIGINYFFSLWVCCKSARIDRAEGLRKTFRHFSSVYRKTDTEGSEDPNEVFA